MKAYILENATPLLPFQKPASRIRLKEGTIGSRLRGQLERRGFDVVEQDALNLGTLARGSLVVQDDVLLSDRFLDAFLAAIPDRGANYRCEIDVSRYPLLTPQDTGRAYRPIPVTFYGDPTHREIALLRMTPTPLHEADDGLPSRMHSLTQIRVYFLDFYGIDITYWFDLQTGSSLYCREHVANTVRLLRMFLPAFVVAWFLASRWLMERSSTVGKNCRIHPTAILEGCVIGDGVQIGAHVCLRASVVADNAVIQEKSSIKGAFVGEGAFVMGTAVVNSYVGAEASLVCPMLFHVVFGERAFISGGSGFADFIVGGGSIKASIAGKEIASNLSFLGSAVGDDCFLGANLIFAPGRTIPDGTRILDHGLIKSVPATAGGSFVMSGATLLQIPDSFLGQRRPS